MHVPLCCFLYVSYGADKENFFQQSRSSLVVDTVVILYWSLYMWYGVDKENLFCSKVKSFFSC